MKADCKFKEIKYDIPTDTIVFSVVSRISGVYLEGDISLPRSRLSSLYKKSSKMKKENS